MSNGAVKVVVADGIYKSACRMCHGVCGVLVHVKNGRVEKITGDPDCPTSHGYICEKGKASVELLYHPDRLLYPLKREGRKGENKWKRIEWEEALETIASKYRECKELFGPESIAMARGTGRPYMLFATMFKRAAGIKHAVTFGHICYYPRVVASWFTCGQLPVCDFYGLGGQKPECVVVWGCNWDEAGASDGMAGHHLALAKKRGAKIIVIDPRRSMAADKADIWLQIRPGTDDALALGMINIIISENLYDHDFVSNWTVGFDKLKEAVREYSPERVAEITWVPKDKIIDAARMYAKTKPAAIQWGVAVDQNINNFQTARAILILMGITGNIDIPGGNVFWVPPQGVKQQSVFYPSPFLKTDVFHEDGMWKMRMKGDYQYPLAAEIHPPTFWQGVVDGTLPIKMMFIMGANLLVGCTHPWNVEAALKKIDFIAAVDLFMTPTTQLADLVLPAASWLETNDVCNLHKIFCVLSRQKVAEAGECRDDRQIIIDLARKLGLEHDFPWRNYDEYLEFVLEGSGVSLGEFRQKGYLMGKMRYKKYLEEGFKTPTKKFEIYSRALEEIGVDPLPGYIEPPESPFSTPDLYREYPLIITTGARRRSYFHSEGRQISQLRKLAPHPRVQINPATAEKYGIEQGDWVIIETRYGKVRMMADLFEGIRPEVISADHGWWFPEKEPPEYGYKESSINMIIGDMPYSREVGSESLKSFLCRIYRES